MSEPEITIRRAVESDAEALHEFMVDLVAERLPVLYRREAAPTVDEERDFIRRFDDAARSVFFVAIREGRVLGVLDFHGEKHAQAAHGGSFGMSVRATERGKGIGERLLRGLIDWAPTVGITRLELQVFANNARAIALYERMGFQVEGRRRMAVMVDGVAIDVLMMATLVASDS